MEVEEDREVASEAGPSKPDGKAGEFPSTSAGLSGPLPSDSVPQETPAPVTTVTVAMAEDNDMPCSSKSLPEVSVT